MNTVSSRKEEYYLKKENKNSSKAIWISIFSLIISFAALVYTIYKDVENSQEQLYISVQSMYHKGDFDTRLIPITLPDSENTVTASGVLPIDYEIVLANNGQNNISLLSYTLKQIENQKPISFSYLDNGLYVENDKLSLPITIEAGESKKVIVKVGYSPMYSIYEILEKRFEENQLININSVRSELVTHDTDLFGNTVIKSDGLIVTESMIRKEYLLTFESSKGNTLSHRFYSDSTNIYE